MKYTTTTIHVLIILASVVAIASGAWQFALYLMLIAIYLKGL